MNVVNRYWNHLNDDVKAMLLEFDDECQNAIDESNFFLNIIDFSCQASFYHMKKSAAVPAVLIFAPAVIFVCLTPTQFFETTKHLES